MRITTNTLFMHALADLSRLQRESFEASRQATSGRRFERPSDAPTDMALTSRLEDRRSELERAVANARLAAERNDVATAHLSELTGIVAEARSHAVQGANGTVGADGLLILAESVEGLLDQALSVANARHRSQLLFAGTATPSVAWELREGNGSSFAVYHGNTERSWVPIGPSESLDVSLAGREALGGRSRGATRIEGTKWRAARRYDGHGSWA